MNGAPFFHVEADTLGTLRVSGTISFANATNALDRIPRGYRGKPVTLDLGGLKNSDSATLAVLIVWAAQARRHDAALHYVHAPPGLRNLARLCEVDQLLGLI